MKDADKIPFIANRFSRIIREWLTPDEILQVLIMNARETENNAINACNTHEFCDSNEAMIRAFRAVMGRDIDFEGETDMELMSSAWNAAKGNHYKQVKQVITAKFHECTVTGAPIVSGSHVLQITYKDSRGIVIQYVADPSYLAHCIKFY